MNVLGYLRTFVRARPGIVILSLLLWLAQSLAELAPGLIVKRFFDALRTGVAQARVGLMCSCSPRGFAGIVMAYGGCRARLPFHVANALGAGSCRRWRFVRGCDALGRRPPRYRA